MEVTRNELKARLYEHGLDVDEPASGKRDQKKGAFALGLRRPASAPRGTRGTAAVVAPGSLSARGEKGTVNISQARRLLTSMKEKTAAAAMGQSALCVVSKDSPSKSPRTRLPELTPRLRSHAPPMSPQHEKQSEPQNGNSTKTPRDSFEVFIEILRGASIREESELEFVYVRHVPGGGPYDVELIPFHAVDPQCYLTVSPHGFTEYFNGLPCEFVLLERWLDERQLYRSVRELRFFNEFAKRKSFHLWRDAWRHESMAKASAVLEERLFMLHAEFRPLLFSVRNHCIEIEKIRLITVDFAHPKSLKDFHIAQRIWRKEVVARASQVAACVHDEVCSTFTSILDRVRRESRGPGAAAALGTNTFGGRAGANRAGNRSNIASVLPARHGVQAKADGEALEALGFPKDIGYGQRSALKKECGRFVRFGWLTDLLTTESLLELSRNSLGDVVLAVSPMISPRSKKAVPEVTSFVTEPIPVFDVPQVLDVTNKPSPLFKIEADISGGVDEADEIADVELWPDRDALTKAMLNAMEESCKLMDVFQRLATHQDLEPYRNVLDPLDAESQPRRRHTTDGEPQDDRQPQTLVTFMDHLVVQDAWLQSVRELGIAMNHAFSEAADELRFFDRHVECCRECLRTDIAAKVDAALEGGSVQGLGGLLKQFESQVSELQSLHPSLTLHVLDVDISKVKIQLLKGPTKCRKHLHVLLPEMVVQRSGNLNEWMIACKRQLTGEPDSISKFVQQVGGMENIGLEVHSRSQQLACVQELCRLIDLHKIEMARPARNQAGGAAREFGEFRQWIASKGFEVSKLKDRFVKELGELEANVESETSSLKAQVCSYDFLILVADSGAFPPGSLSPVQGLVAMGKAPTLFNGDQPLKDVKAEADVKEKVERLADLQQKHEALCATLAAYNNYQDMLGQEQTPWPELDVLKADLTHRNRLWKAMQIWQEQFLIWITTPLLAMATEDVTKEVAALWAEVREAQGGLPQNALFEELRTLIMLMKDSLPAIAALQNPHIKERHCKSVSEALQTHLDPGFSSLLVGTLVELDVARHRSEIQNIGLRATQEHIVEVQLEDLEATWSGIEFSFIQYRPEQRDSFVLDKTDHLMALLDDSLVTVNAMLSSKAVQPHLEAARGWKRKLDVTQQTLQEWIYCQSKWKYLERIFVVPDIQKQLIRESTTFTSVDIHWRQIMMDTQTNPNVINACAIPGLRESLEDHRRTLETVESELNDYLQTKRMAFPRFYFLSNEELLTIIAHGREPQMIDLHVGKCFGGIHRLDFGEERNLDIQGMYSEEGERVGLQRSKIRAHIEETFDVIQLSMLYVLRAAVRAALEDAHEHFAAGPLHHLDCVLADWAFGQHEPPAQAIGQHHHPAQAIHTASQITFCSAVEQALSTHVEESGSPRMVRKVAALPEWHKTTRLSSLSQLAQQELTSLQRRAVLALLTSEVHNRDILDSLVAAITPATMGEGADCFEWQKQLRYYWEFDERLDLADQPDICIIRHVNSRYSYAFEYEGVSSRLVVTPLTERCWLSITQASQMKKGTAVGGLAGTGKSETVKDLAKALAVLCFEFNCGDQLSPRMSGQLLAGLVQQGCWACLDEFNCVEVEVLSVIAQQLSKVQHALRTNLEKLEFEGAILPLKHSVNVCITLHPQGRSDNLPDNLLVLLRPVSLAIPNFACVGEVVLLAEGFPDAPALAAKLVMLCKCCSDYFAGKSHCDFGLRTLRAVMARAGELRRLRVQAEAESDTVLTAAQQGSCLVQALKEAHNPRLSTTEASFFKELLSDLFHGHRDPSIHDKEIMKSIRAASSRLSLKPLPVLLTKAAEISVACSSRLGVLLIGPAGAGKSTALRTLSEALCPQLEATQEMASPVHVHRLNPKTLSFVELFGSISSATGEWIQGLVTRLFQPSLTTKGGDDSSPLQWVIFDGPIDPSWIESLNGVLDEKRVLCLANSERIRVPDELRLFFEADEIGSASPAIVSRCAAVYHPDMEKRGLEVCLENCLEVLRESWLSKASFDALTRSADTLVLQALRELGGSQSEEVAPVTGLQMIRTFGELLAATLKPKPFSDPVITPSVLHGSSTDGMGTFSESFPPPISEAVPTSVDQDQYISSCLAFALAWTFGARGDAPHRAQVNAWCKLNIPQMKLPAGSDLYDVMVDWRSSTGYFTRWEKVLPAAPTLSQVSFSELIMPTTDLASHSWIAFTRARCLSHTLLFGAPGNGKTMIGTHMLRQPQQIQPWSTIDMIFSAWTSADQVQRVLEKRLHQKKTSKLGAPSGTKVLVFVDDVNAPLTDASNSRAPLELLWQVVDTKGGFYDRKTWSWQDVEDTAFVAAAGMPVVGAPWLTPRLSRHFAPLRLPDPSRQILLSIFGTLISQLIGTLIEPSSEIARMGPTVCKASIELFFLAAAAFRPAPSTPFYAFNFRDIWRVVQGLNVVRPSAGGNISTGHDLTKLWAHEAIRVFQDRIAPGAGRREFSNFVDGVLQSHFKTQWRPSKEGAFRYGDFLRPNVDGVRSYEQLQDEAKLQTVLQDLMKEYNKEFGGANPLRLVFFAEAISHLCRLVRSCRLHRSHSLVVGLTGSGRRSLCGLAAFIAEVRRYAVTASSATEFREFLKGVLRNCGVRGQAGIIILTDGDITDEVFLEDLVALINIGNIPNLWGAEESETIRKETKSIYDAHHGLDGRQPEGKTVMEKHVLHDDDPDGPWQLFLSHIRDLLHTMLCMTPAGKSLRTRCRRFPALTTCCYVDYFEPWPEEALFAVAAAYLEEVPGVASQKGAVASLAAGAVRAHAAALRSAELCAQEGWRVHIMPTCHLEMVCLYVDLATRKRTDLERSRGRLLVGLAKLKSSTAHVRELEQELLAIKPKLDEKEQKTEHLREKVALDKTLAESICHQLETEKDAVENKKNEIREVEDEAKAELEAAMPEYRMALAAVDKLDKKDLQEIKSFQNPPPLVLMVMQCISMLLGHSTDWVTIKNVISEAAFLKRLKDLSESIVAEKHTLPEKTAAKLKSYVRREEFDPKEVEKQSHPARSLCMWCRSLSLYIDVAKEVEPKRARARTMHSDLQEATTRSEAKQVEFDEMLTKVSALESSQHRTEEELKQLQTDKSRTERRLSCARELTGALKEEETRWMKQSAELAEDLESMLGDVFLAAASIAYAGPFNQKDRAGLVGRWLQICKDSYMLRNYKLPWTLQRVMLQASTVQEWKRQGLPTDDVSVDSATIVKSATRWPFCIDPQGQAGAWIRRHTERSGLKEVETSSLSLSRSLEDCAHHGVPLLLTDCAEQLPKVLEPWLNLTAERRSGHTGGAQDASQAEGFALYMVTSLRCPQLLPQVFVSTSVVNFAVSFAGLCERLLSEVVQLECPDLEKKREDLVLRMADDQQALDNLSEKVLSLLSESEGNILDQSDLIENLSSSKEVAGTIASRVADRRAAEQRLEQNRAAYRPVAERGAVLYFAAASMEAVCQMYACSLSRVVQVFVKAIAPTNGNLDSTNSADELGSVSSFEQEAEVSKTLDMKQPESPMSLHGNKSGSLGRIDDLVQAVTHHLLTSLLSGFFERHRLVAALHFCIELGKLRGEVSEKQCALLMKGGDALEDPRFLVPEDPLPSIPEDTPDKLCFPTSTWKALRALAILEPATFQNLPSDIQQDLPIWCAALAAHDATLAAALDLPPSQYEPPGLSDAMLEGATVSLDHRSLCATFPGCWGTEYLNRFEQLLLLRAVQPLQLLDGLRKFVTLTLGRSSAALQPSLSEIYNTSECRMPIMIVLAQGIDPYAELAEVANSVLGGSQPLRVVSLGRGQGEKACQVIDVAIQKGHWVLLQNCHLAQSWLPSLDRYIVRSLSDLDAPVHEQFRLFLANSMTSPVPISLLHRCTKVTYEPPRGVRASLVRIIDEDFDRGGLWEQFSSHKDGRRLLVALTLFHSVLRERQKFGSLGFNHAYCFADGDRNAAQHTLTFLLESAGNNDPSWDSLLSIIADVHYSGRVVDDFDRRCVCATFSYFLPQSFSSASSIFDDSFFQGFLADTPSNLEDMRRLANILPTQDDPVMFGMHAHAEIPLRGRQAHELLALLEASQGAMPPLYEFELSDASPQQSPSKGSAALPRSSMTLAARLGRRGLLAGEASAASGSNITRLVAQLIADVPRPRSEIVPSQNDEAKSITFAHQSVDLSKCMMAFLERESACLEVLLGVIRDNLEALSEALAGRASMSESLEVASHALRKGQLPNAWQTVAYPSQRPLASWVTNLQERANWLRKWEAEKELPWSFPISNFFYPQGFLTSVLQAYSRSSGAELETLTMLHTVKSALASPADVRSAPIRGVLIHGLYIEGGRWDVHNQQLEDCRPGALFSSMPLIHFVPVAAGGGKRDSESTFRRASLESFSGHLRGSVFTRSSSGVSEALSSKCLRQRMMSVIERKSTRPLQDADQNTTSTRSAATPGVRAASYESPLYRTSVRADSLPSSGRSTHCICSVFLPTAVSASRWILRGVSLVCEPDE